MREALASARLTTTISPRASGLLNARAAMVLMHMVGEPRTMQDHPRYDDVVDEADLRRGRRTARKVWGNQISILVGDFLYTKAMCNVVEFQSQGINEVIAEACNKMAEGEVLQLYYNGNPAMPEVDYIKIVEHKTAGLIAAACQMGAILADATETQQHALFRFGQYLGIAFQVADDTLDYIANGESLGKTIGQDLRQGKATLHSFICCNIAQSRTGK
ncbi:MAG: hypothetical protein HC801_10520 [Nitrospira sp.]|nr:hypothetical protein [Nitrospira sp.]